MCLQCGEERGRTEDWTDIIVQVLGNKDLIRSLANAVAFEDMEGSNRIHCPVCDEKARLGPRCNCQFTTTLSCNCPHPPQTDSKKGMVLKSVPPVLVLSLK